MATTQSQHPFKIGSRVLVIERRNGVKVEIADTVSGHHANANGNFTLAGTGARQFKAYSLPQKTRTLWRAHATGVPAGVVYEVRPADDAPHAAQIFTDAVERLRAISPDRTPANEPRCNTPKNTVQPIRERPLQHPALCVARDGPGQTEFSANRLHRGDV